MDAVKRGSTSLQRLKAFNVSTEEKPLPYFGNKHRMGFPPCLLSLMPLIAVELTDEF